MDRNFLITPVVLVERKPQRVVGKLLIPQTACTRFCDMLNMRSLSANDDRGAEGNRQKAQGGGSRNNSNNGRKQKEVQLFESVSFE